MPRPRCPTCGRLDIPGDVNGTLPSLEAVKPHLVTLLKYAQDFDANTPEGEHYSGVDVIDFIALCAAGGEIPGSETRKYSIPAGKPGGKRKKVA